MTIHNSVFVRSRTLPQRGALEPRQEDEGHHSATLEPRRKKSRRNGVGFVVSQGLTTIGRILWDRRF